MKTKVIEIDFNALAARWHGLCKPTWWTDLTTGQPILRNKDELTMLMVSEVSEALEGVRKNLPDDKLPHRSMEEVEMADTLLRIVDYAGAYSVKLTLITSDLVFFQANGNKAAQLLLITRNLVLARTGIHDNCEPSYFSMAATMIVRYCETHGLDLLGALEEKMAYNLERADHKAEARLGKHGKKF